MEDFEAQGERERERYLQFDIKIRFDKNTNSATEKQGNGSVVAQENGSVVAQENESGSWGLT